VERAHRAFVWPEIRLPKAQTPLGIRLRNDGTGVAYNVRWSLGTLAPKPGHDWESGKVVADYEWARQNHSLVKRAMKPGDSHPSAEGWTDKKIALPEDDIWWVLVRWTDVAGTRWEVTDQGPAMLAHHPYPLRAHFWQLWRRASDW